MRILKTMLIVGSLLAATVSRAENGDTADVRELLENRIAIFERAAENRELAAATQMGHAHGLERLAAETQEAGVVEEGETEVDVYKKVGALERNVGKLYGFAATNFDKAAASRQRVEELSSRLGKSEKTRSAKAYAARLKTQADAAMQLAGAACERAAVAYDKANETAEVAAASQQAAVWMETLALR